MHHPHTHFGRTWIAPGTLAIAMAVMGCCCPSLPLPTLICSPVQQVSETSAEAEEAMSKPAAQTLMMRRH